MSEQSGSSQDGSLVVGFVSPQERMRVLPEVVPAQEVVMQRDVVWHSVRGYNFAALAGILADGITPTSNVVADDSRVPNVVTEKSVAVSVCPYTAYGVDRAADTFEAYSLGDGISVGIKLPYVLRPTHTYGGFMDEARVPYVHPAQVVAAMVSDTVIDQPLRTLPSTGHEPRKPQVNLDYIKQTIEHLESLGLDTGRLRHAVAPYAETNHDGQTLDVARTTELQKLFTDAYAAALEGMGFAEPRVIDLLGVIIGARPDLAIRVAVHDERLRTAIATANRKRSRNS